MADREIDVALLGPVTIEGVTHRFRRSAARELVAYLALHRQGARNEVWVEALWPTRRVSEATVHSTVSDARHALGVDSAGRSRLLRHGRCLALADSVTSDVERFAELASGRDSRSWRAALTLVRGLPFAGLGQSDWAIFDGTQAQVESMVVRTALKAADHALRRGEGARAEWMVRQAMLASPYDDRLYRALLRAADAQGNLAGLRAAMAELRALSGSGPFDPADDLGRWSETPMHPQTEALYRELARGPMPVAGGVVPRL
jgi:DNA-binding SARP family transcriptional activator